MTRRDILGRGAVAAGGLAALSPLTASTAAASAAASDAGFAPALAEGPFPPVRVSPERVIRTVVGLRPYRPGGFVLRAERFGRKTLVHNYGHGGGGVTLSWGCAEEAAYLAAEAARDRGVEAAAVLGGGVMGLSTALLLARRGLAVTLYADALPPDTTSNIAGALWYPSSVFDDEVASPEFLEQFVRCARRSQRLFQHHVGDPAYGVSWIRYLELRRRETPEGPLLGGEDLYPGLRREADPARYFGFDFTESYTTLMIDPDLYLRALLRDVEGAGVSIRLKRFDEISQVAALRERVIVNCTGLGAAKLFGDEDLVPARGQLTLLLPQSEIRYGYVTSDSEAGLLYMFPRQGSIVLGGSFRAGNGDLTVDPEEAAKKLAAHARIAAAGLGGAPADPRDIASASAAP